MTRIEYDLLRADQIELRLPDFRHLKDSERDRVQQLNREELIAGRALVMLRADRINALGFPVYSK